MGAVCPRGGGTRARLLCALPAPLPCACPRLPAVQHLPHLTPPHHTPPHPTPKVLNEQHVGPRAAAVLAALQPVLSGALSDLQQRLIYRAQAFIKQEVEGKQPGPDECDFPARGGGGGRGARRHTAPTPPAGALTWLPRDLGPHPACRPSVMPGTGWSGSRGKRRRRRRARRWRWQQQQAAARAARRYRTRQRRRRQRKRRQRRTG
jgi:hypothetical protein